MWWYGNKLLGTLQTFTQVYPDHSKCRSKNEVAHKEEALETSPEPCWKKKILVCFHDNSQHQQSRAKSKWNKHSTTIVTAEEHLSDRW